MAISLVFTSGFQSAEKKKLTRDNIVAMAKKYIGTRYVFGGSSPKGFDCSGYIKYVYGKFGLKFPHSSRRQHKMLKKVRKPKKGDLVFYRTYTPKVSHVGIYVGNGKFLHAPTTGKTVSYTKMKYRYWRKRYAGARTVFTEEIVTPKVEKEKKYDQELLDFEMIQAIYKGNLKAFKKYLKLGANPKVVYRDFTPLLLAAKLNRIDMVKVLLKKRVDVNHKNKNGVTALALAESRGNKEIGSLLFANGAYRTRIKPKKRAMIIPDITKELF